ncbi:hypothetical protein ACFRCQ_26935 [Cytobacillus firmus]|uniref:hypothetical protein n=1 Tax=Cytobacillus firmus TaxID=1399 RepID=UPI0036B0B299
MSLVSYFWRVTEYFSQSDKRGISYIGAADGQIYEVRESMIGKMVAKPPAIPSLDNLTERFSFRLPKIPGHIFNQMYSFFKDFCLRSDVEVMLQLYFDTETKRYFLECPVQHVSKVKVHAELDPKYLGRNSLRFIQVAQVHSHNSMSAYFSATDNQDEKAFMIYGVFGLLNTDTPQAKFRVKGNDTELAIPIDQIFESGALVEVPYPAEWETRVKYQ